MLTKTAIPEVAVQTEPSRVLFQSPLVQVGQFRCPTFHPRFPDSGPTRGYLFVFPRTAVWIQHEGRAPFVADSTIVPLYNPGIPYARRQISQDGDHTDWFGVTSGVLRDALASYDARVADSQHRLFQRDFARATERTFLAQRCLFQHVRSGLVSNRMYVEETVLTLLDQVLSSIYGSRARTEPESLRHRALAEEARAQMNLHFAGHQDLTAFATSVGASVFHLCRVFRRHTGHTIHGYRRQLRLRKSLELLGESQDIVGIALALGYSGHSHFTAAFGRAFGLTPSAFRMLTRERRTQMTSVASMSRISADR